jgi:hypothetical protein
MKQTAVLSQFLHSLNVKPCTPTVNIQEAEKILMAVRNTPCTAKGLLQAYLAGDTPEAASQIFTPYGGLEKNLNS